jgi:hypothetical protein
VDGGVQPAGWNRIRYGGSPALASVLRHGPAARQAIARARVCNPGKPYLDWDLPDLAGLSLEDIRPIRDDIQHRVEDLLSQLIPGA